MKCIKLISACVCLSADLQQRMVQFAQGTEPWDEQTLFIAIPRYFNELVIENFDENGEAVDGMILPNGATMYPLLICGETRRRMLPPRYFRIED